MKAKIYLSIMLWNIILCSFKSYAQSPVVIYDDAIGAGLTFNSWPGTGGSIAESTLSPYSGTKDIEWVVSTKNTHLGLDFWPVKDLSTHTSNNYVLEFYFKSASVSYASKMNLKCKFIDYISGAAAQWENVYTLTPTQLICDGFWHRVSVPLSFFQDVGTWKGSTFYPAGNFVWNAINRLRFMTDQNNELQGATIYFDEIKIIPAAVATSATDYFRTQKSGNWNSVDIWESSFNNLSWIAATSVPTSAAASINILNSHSIVIEANQSIANLTLNTGSVLSVNPNKQLTINSTFINNGTLNLLSDASGTATILTPASIGGSGITNVEQYLTSLTTGVLGRNWYISSPLTAATSSTITASTGNGLVYYDGTTNWPDAGTTMEVMKGYIAKSPAQNTTINFTGGSLNTGSKSVSDLPVGFNLVGNPYPSHVNWTDAVKMGISTSIWYRSKSTGSYLFQTYNVAGEGISVNGGTNIISPMQAFWIKVTDATNTLGFSNAMRSHQDQSVETNRLKVPKASTQKLLRLQVSNGTNKDEAVVYFQPNAQNSVDEFDSQKMFNNITDVPEIYTQIETEKLVINGMSEIQYDTEIPVGFSTLQANSFSIKLSELNNFDSNTIVVLKDNNLKIEQDLTVGTAYHFESGVTNTSNRFSLIFRTPDNVTGVDKTTQLNAQIFVNTKNQIIIIAPEKCRYIVYNALGQNQLDGILKSTRESIDKRLNSGIYFVELSTANRRKITKVIVR